MKYVIAGILRATVLAIIWVFFAGWSADYAIYGVVSVAAATAFSLALLPPQGNPNPLAWPRRAWFVTLLLGWFLWQSAKGGVDVAIRALKRTPDIDPEVITAKVALPEGHARQVAMLMMNLMPGSMIQRGPLTTEGPDAVELHTLSATLKPAEQWRQLQQRTARAFD